MNSKTYWLSPTSPAIPKASARTPPPFPRCSKSAASRPACWKSRAPRRPSMARSSTPGATRTIVFYAHYDGQPLDPKEWATPPWEPVMRDRPLDKDGRVIALPADGKSIPSGGSTPAPPATTRPRSSPSPPRSTRSSPRRSALRSNLKFVFEGEEEAGSPHLAADHPAQYKDLLASRRLADLRRPGAPEPAPADRLRRARHRRASISPSTARATNCTAATTATGRPTRR